MSKDGEKRIVSSSLCPVCKSKVTRRSLVRVDNLVELITAFNSLVSCYKDSYGKDYDAADDDANDDDCIVL